MSDSKDDVRKAKRRKLKKRKRSGSYTRHNILKEGHKPSIRHIREYIIYTFLGIGSFPRWIEAPAVEHTQKFVFCSIPGLPANEFLGNLGQDSKLKKELPIDISNTNNSDLSFFKDTFSKVIPMQLPGNKHSIFSLYRALTSVPISKRGRQKLKNVQEDVKIENLLLSRDQLIDNGYPYEKNSKDEGWQCTRTYPERMSRILALDCEFCLASHGYVLTRISVVDSTGVLMDSLVKPSEQIIDYKTKYSGIDEKTLYNVKTTFEEIRDRLLDLVSANDILVGHSLNSDLEVLKIEHKKIIDTSVIYEHPRGLPSKPGLKWLAEKYLKINIQKGEISGTGHSSVEDAKACLDLLHLKLKNGRYFGTFSYEISLFEKLNSNPKKPVKSLNLDYSVKTNNFESMNLKKVRLHNDDEAAIILEEEIERTDLVIMALRELEFNLRWAEIPQEYNGKLYEDGKVDFSTLHKDLNSRLMKLYKALPVGTILIIFSNVNNQSVVKGLKCNQEGNQNHSRSLEHNDVTSKEVLKAGMSCQTAELEEALTEARQAIAFIGME